MTFSLDTISVDIPCPQCGKQLKEKIGRMKRNKHITCPVCGRMAVNTDQLRCIEDGVKKKITQIGGKKITVKL